MGAFFIPIRNDVYMLPTELVGKQHQMLRRVLVRNRYITRSVIHTNASVEEVIVAIRQGQRMLLIDLPLQTCFWTQLADVLTIGRRLAIGYWRLAIGYGV